MAIRLPSFTYGGEYTTYAGEKYWYIYLKSGGKLRFAFDKTVDVFLVGGGGAGGSGNGASGGGGGYVRTVSGKSLTKDTDYPIVIGAGGIPKYADDGGQGGRGGTTEAFGYTALGGYGGIFNGAADKGAVGGAGGSGGGAGVYTQKSEAGGAGGSNGNDGSRTVDAVGGRGSRSITRAFGETSGKIYAGGGGGSSRSTTGGAGGEGGGGNGAGEGGEIEDGESGEANTGGGGGGASWQGLGGYGGTGLVIIRSTMPDYLPVYFNGTRLTDIYYQKGNGGTKHKLDTLTFNSTKLY